MYEVLTVADSLEEAEDIAVETLNEDVLVDVDVEVYESYEIGGVV
jgi:hypothetical protein